MIDAFATIGRQTADRRLGDKAQEVVALHLQWLTDIGEDARRREHAAEFQTVDLEVSQALQREGLDGVVETLSLVLSVLDGFAVVVHIAVLTTFEDRIFFVLGETTVVVGTVDTQRSHEVGQGRAHQLFEVEVRKIGHIELQAVDARHLENVFLIVEVAVCHLQDKLVTFHLAAEMHGAVAPHMHRVAAGRIGMHHHLMAVTDNELFHATDDEVVVEFVGVGSTSVADTRQIHAGVDTTCGALQRQRVVVETFGS